MQPETAGGARASGGARLKRRWSCNWRRRIHADMRDGMEEEFTQLYKKNDGELNGMQKKKKDFG